MTCQSARRASYNIATQRFNPRTIPVIAANPWYLELHAGGDRLPEKSAPHGFAAAHCRRRKRRATARAT
jgi:hypothetical protein